MADSEDDASSEVASAIPHRPKKPSRNLPSPPPPPPPDTDAPSSHITADAGMESLASIIGTEDHNHSPHDEGNLDARLTPLRAHYLKKTLISLQFDRELNIISSAPHSPNVSTLSYLGPPFSRPPRNAPLLDLPFLKYVFRHFVLTFPFLATAPKNFFSEKLQPFVASALSRNLSPTIDILDARDGKEEYENAARQKIIDKVALNCSFLLTAATKLVEEEEVVRLSQADLDKLESIARKRGARSAKLKNTFDVNIVCIRVVTERGRIRNKIHEEFIIRTRRSKFPDVFVSRRYGDFKTLAEELRKRYPEELVRSPPPKDRSAVSTSTTPSSPTGTHMPGFYVSESNNGDFVSLSTQQTIQNVRLKREKNRLTLRAYLNSILDNPTLASSPVLLHFLTSQPTRLRKEEEEDTRTREEADRKRDEGRIHFAREISARVEGLRSAITIVKEDIMSKGGLSRVFGVIRATENVHDLPREYRSVLEWGRITFASTIFQHFVACDDASENLAHLKRLHGLMPYMILKGLLKVSNPMAMIRGVLDLFLAQPFGGRSLLQKMFSSSLQEEVRALKGYIDSVKRKINDDIICEKVRLFIYAPKEIQNAYKADAATQGVHLLTVVLRPGENPTLTSQQMYRVAKAHRAYAEYSRQRSHIEDSDDDEGPQNEDAWLFEDLAILAKLYAQLRDKEQLIELIFEGTTADLLKDILTIFYTPLAQVYKAASIADSLGDLQNFLNDLIRTVESVEETSQTNPQRVVHIIVELVERHEQAFYAFVHKVHAKGEGLFGDLTKWIEGVFAVFTEGIGEKISLEFLLPHTGPQRVALMKEIDQIAAYHYKRKLAHEVRLRRRFGRSQGGQSQADAEDEATQMLVDGIVRDFSFSELLDGDAQEMAAAESDEDDESEDDGSEDEDDEDEEEDEEDSERDGSGIGRILLDPSAPSGSGCTSSSEHWNRSLPMAMTSALAFSASAPPSPQQATNNSAQRVRQHYPDPLHGICAEQSSHMHEQSASTSGHPSTKQPTRAKASLSRSRSISSLKSMFSRKTSLETTAMSQTPPVPPLPASLPGSPSSEREQAWQQVLPPVRATRSSLSTRSISSSTCNRAGAMSAGLRNGVVASSGSQTTPLPVHLSTQKKKEDVAMGLAPPDLKEVVNLIPVFVEMMRPILR